MTKVALREKIVIKKWDTHAKELLARTDAGMIIKERKLAASEHKLAAIFFSTEELDTHIEQFASREVESGRSKNAVYVSVMRGGKPFHTDLVAAIERISKEKVKTDHIWTSAYDGPIYVGAHVLTEAEYMPKFIKGGDEVVLVDDGIDTAGSLVVTANFLKDQYGITSVSTLTALTKQPGMTIKAFRNCESMFATPFGPWGEGYGFDNDEFNRNTRLIGLSMTQPESAYPHVEHVLKTLGGIDGFAVATMDEIIAYNKK